MNKHDTKQASDTMSDSKSPENILRLRLKQQFARYPLLIYIDDDEPPTQVTIDISRMDNQKHAAEEIMEYGRERFSEFEFSYDSSTDMVVGSYIG